MLITLGTERVKYNRAKLMVLAHVKSELLDKFFYCLHCACKKVTTKPFVLKFYPWNLHDECH